MFSCLIMDPVESITWWAAVVCVNYIGKGSLYEVSKTYQIHWCELTTSLDVLLSPPTISTRASTMGFRVRCIGPRLNVLVDVMYKVCYD